MEKLKFAVLGCGFWSKFQIGAWSELDGVELVAVYNRTISKAQNIADYFKVPQVYDNPEELFKKKSLILSILLLMLILMLFLWKWL